MRYPVDYLLAERLADIKDRTKWQHILDKLTVEERDNLGKAVYDAWIDGLPTPEPL